MKFKRITLKKKKNVMQPAWTFFAGLGVGAAIGMLVAPKRGAELREDLGEYAREAYEQGRERVQPAVDAARERVAPVMDRVSQSVDSVMAQASSVRDRVVDKASDVKERVLNGSLLSILNEWPHERLIEIDGIGPVLATKIIQHRPYESEQQLIDLKALPPSAIESLRKAA
jgi:gas vesicle protein